MKKRNSQNGKKEHRNQSGSQKKLKAPFKIGDVVIFKDEYCNIAPVKTSTWRGMTIKKVSKDEKYQGGWAVSVVLPGCSSCGSDDETFDNYSSDWFTYADIKW